MLISGRHLGNIDEAEATLIVFKDSGSDKAPVDEFQIKLGSNFLEQDSHWKQFSHYHAESNTFSCSAAESNFRLESSGPNDGTSKKSENKSSL